MILSVPYPDPTKFEDVEILIPDPVNYPAHYTDGGIETASDFGVDHVNTALFQDFPPPLRDNLAYLDAALSFYAGSAADEDVESAWRAVVRHLRNTTLTGAD